MTEEFVVIYDWGGCEKALHYFDTLEEAVEERMNYTNPRQYPIFQRVKETTKFTLTNGDVVEA